MSLTHQKAVILCGVPPDPKNHQKFDMKVFFFVFIKPYVPGLSLLTILPRALFPGIIMTVILLHLWLPALQSKTEMKPAEVA